jgi:predicted protein tyrosine phosphatase
MDWLKEEQQKANYTLDSVDIERARIVAIIEAKYKQKLIDKRTAISNNKTNNVITKRK